jgi:hypothetical protein
MIILSSNLQNINDVRNVLSYKTSKKTINTGVVICLHEEDFNNDMIYCWLGQNKFKLETIFSMVGNNNKINLELNIQNPELISGLIKFINLHNANKYTIISSQSLELMSYIIVKHPGTETALVVNYSPANKYADILNSYTLNLLNYLILDNRILLQNIDFDLPKIKYGLLLLADEGITSTELPAIMSDHRGIEMIVTNDLEKTISNIYL